MQDVKTSNVTEAARRSLRNGALITGDAAKELGVSIATLRNWRRQDPKLGPSSMISFGRWTSYVYTKRDITRIRKIKGDTRART